nr:MAG TPA: hypothetical protein [Bacteriophage sp.]
MILCSDLYQANPVPKPPHGQDKSVFRFLGFCPRPS